MHDKKYGSSETVMSDLIEEVVMAQNDSKKSLGQKLDFVRLTLYSYHTTFYSHD